MESLNENKRRKGRVTYMAVIDIARFSTGLEGIRFLRIQEREAKDNVIAETEPTKLGFSAQSIF